MTEEEIRERMVVHGKSMFERGYTCGGLGNLSVRLTGGVLVTPTNSCLGRLEKDRISKLDWEGKIISGDPPSKEWALHLAVYRVRPDAGAIVHLHSPHAVAVSCLNGLNPDNVLPPFVHIVEPAFHHSGFLAFLKDRPYCNHVCFPVNRPGASSGAL